MFVLSIDDLSLRCAALMLGFLIDAVFADFRRLQPFFSHPVIWVGSLIDKADYYGNRRTDQTKTWRMVKGLIVFLGVTGGCFFAGYMISLGGVLGGIQLIVEGFFIGWLLALRALLRSAWRVEALLGQGRLQEARKALRWLAGRKPDHLNESMLRLAVIESVTENFCDGVLAPAFWYLFLGLPGLFAYKAINTLDSMIGHRCEKYFYFGKASAIGDDLANFIPARLSAILLCLVALPVPKLSPWAGFYGVWRYPPFLGRYLIDRWRGKNLASLNAVIPQSVVSGILSLQLGGQRFYQEAGDKKPRSVLSTVGKGRKKAEASDVHIVCRLTVSATVFLWILIALLWVGAGKG